MSSKLISFLKNFSYTFTSNIISLVISTLIVVVIPKLIGVEMYGYWQLYIFYSSYVGFMHFGWNDGIYLRYGGKEYGDLKREQFFSQFYMLLGSQMVIGTVLYIVSLALDFGPDRRFILQMTAVCLVLNNVRGMLTFILQATNRFKEYAKITILDRLLYVLFIVGFLFLNLRDYRYMIGADLLGKGLSLAYAMWVSREIVLLKLSRFQWTLKETWNNISAGIMLMLSSIASMLIIGIVRFGIEQGWSVGVFGKVSLTLSISNLFMTFINAIGLILFPLLRRTDESRYKDLYLTMRSLLMPILLGVLVLYHPIRVVLSSWLPQYTDSLLYMAILFPISVYEGKMSLLIITYLNTMRKERQMLLINLVTLAVSLTTTVVTTYVLGNLVAAILTIPVLLALRSILAEVYLTKKLGISVLKDIVIELAMSALFILSGWYFQNAYTLWIYGGAYVIYLLCKRRSILSQLKQLRNGV
ncbi:hypothetical protein [Proteiniclasticum sp.]|uniref:hypothetical protein n=1 Tax=Proteiniclasticum sp. TaxID=2053595 RepID=UPI0028A0A07B|nr:hypothetical protein [Proteiniclasticum sp.]